MGKLIVRKGPIWLLNHNQSEHVSALALYLPWDAEHAQKSHRIGMVLNVVVVAKNLQVEPNYARYNNIISI